MNSAIRKLESASLYLGVLVGSILTTLSYDYLHQRGLTDYLLVIALFLILAVTMQILLGLCRTIINSSPVVRRIILRRDYIEGLWIDAATSRGPESCGLYVIRYADDSYHITGKEFSSTGEVLYDWQSITSYFDGDRLVYLYLTHSHLKGAVEDSYGVTSLTFMRSGPNTLPRIATGSFIDAGTTFRQLATSAEKLSNYDLESLTNLSKTKQLIGEWMARSSQG
jgi:hypothetical protein